MVIDRRGRSTLGGDRRGQLILVGAIAIAILLVGLTVVVNAAVFTEAVGSQGTVESIKDGGTASLELERAVGATVASVNAGQRYDDENQLEAHIEGNLSALDRNLSRLKADSSGTYVLLDEEASISEPGTRITQDETAAFTRANDSSGEWTPVRDDEAEQIGALTLEIHVSDSDLDDEFTLTLNDTQAADEASLTIRGDPGDVEIDDGHEVCTVDADDWLYVDVTRGDVVAYDCEFDLFGELDQPDTVEFDGGEHINGTYDIVVDGDNFDVSDDRFGEDDDQPYPSLTAWAVEVDYVVDTDDVTNDVTDREVSVYP